MANLIKDQVTTLDIQLFLGNEFTVPLTVDDSLPMPNIVSCTTYNQAGGSPLSNQLQPVVTIAGRLITITFPAHTLYPKAGYHEIKFDGRKVLAGSLIGLRQTVGRAAKQQLTISAESTNPVELSLAVDVPQLGQLRFLNNVLEFWSGLLWLPVPKSAFVSGFPYTFPIILQ